VLLFLIIFCKIFHHSRRPQSFWENLLYSSNFSWSILWLHGWWTNNRDYILTMGNWLVGRRK